MPCARQRYYSARRSKGSMRRRSANSTRSCAISMGRPNKRNIGANALLGISLANARAAAASLGFRSSAISAVRAPRTLPVPMMNVINGGKHAEGALQFQECMIVPVGAPTLAEAVRYGAESFHALGQAPA